jgi:hypothetical protein
VEDAGRFYSNTNWKWRTVTTTTTTHAAGKAWTGHYGNGYSNAHGRYVNGVWKSWEETDTKQITNFSSVPRNADGTLNYPKKKVKNKEPKEKEVHTQTLFVVAGEDGSIKFAERSVEFLKHYGSGYLICPNCYEDKYLDDDPHKVGDTLCQSCGAVFLDWTGEIILFDLDTVRQNKPRPYNAIVGPVPSHLTPAERQLIIDAQTEELMQGGYY